MNVDGQELLPAQASWRSKWPDASLSYIFGIDLAPGKVSVFSLIQITTALIFAVEGS